MFATILYFLPSIVSGLWCVIFLTKMKNLRQTLFTVLLAAFTFYFATNAIYIIPATNYDALVKMDAIDIPLVLMILATIIIYFHFLRTKPRFSGVQITLFVPAIIVGTIANLLYYIIGFDNAATLIELADKGMPIPPEYKTEIYRVYNFFSEPFVNFCAVIFFIFIGVEYILVAQKKGYHFGDITRFFFRGKTLPLEFAIATLFMFMILLSQPMTLFGRRFYLDHATTGIIICFMFAIVQHFICYIEYYSDSLSELTLYRLFHLQIAPVTPVASDDVAQDAPDAHEVKVISSRMTKVAERFRQMMEEDRIYRDENISLGTIAEEIGVSRASLSTLIVNTYGMSFRELLTKYRIEHAQRFMLANPTATQEVVARECGYKNAQYLNSRFKELTGSTPAMWMAQNSSHETSRS